MTVFVRNKTFRDEGIVYIGKYMPKKDGYRNMRKITEFFKKVYCLYKKEGEHKKNEIG